MNRYLLKIPYSFIRYGNYTCTVLAASEEDALHMSRDFSSHNSVEYNDGDNDIDFLFDYDMTQVELEEEDSDDPFPSNNHPQIVEQIPEYFLSELILI